MKCMTKMLLGLSALGLAALPLCAAPAVAAEHVTIGQATPTLSFLPIYAARALGSFKKVGMDLEWAAISGGDPSTLAALDSGDIDFAAVGSDTALQAISKGSPFQIVYSVISRVTLQLVVSDKFLQRKGIDPSAPLKKRIASLRDAIIGVSAIGGAQDRMLRWLAKQGGLDPSKELRIAQVGPPPALQAALENGRVDGFILSPPQGYIAQKRKYGRILIDLGKELPAAHDIPYLALVAKTPVKAKLTVDTIRALQEASKATLTDTKAVADKIHDQSFQKADKAAIVEAVETMKAGIADGGRLTTTNIGNLLKLSEESGVKNPKETGEGTFWTNKYVAAAAAEK